MNVPFIGRNAGLFQMIIQKTDSVNDNFDTIESMMTRRLFAGLFAAASTGVAIPHPNSYGGGAFFNQYPEWKQLASGWDRQSMIDRPRLY